MIFSHQNEDLTSEKNGLKVAKQKQWFTHQRIGFKKTKSGIYHYKCEHNQQNTILWPWHLDSMGFLVACLRKSILQVVKNITL